LALTPGEKEALVDEAIGARLRKGDTTSFIMVEQSQMPWVAMAEVAAQIAGEGTTRSLPRRQR
jgi:hypothetical protein